jgi:hypothetical protein
LHIQPPDVLLRLIDHKAEAGNGSGVNVFQAANHVSRAKQNQQGIDDDESQTCWSESKT